MKLALLSFMSLTLCDIFLARHTDWARCEYSHLIGKCWLAALWERCVGWDILKFFCYELNQERCRSIVWYVLKVWLIFLLNYSLRNRRNNIKSCTVWLIESYLNILINYREYSLFNLHDCYVKLDARVAISSKKIAVKDRAQKTSSIILYENNKESSLSNNCMLQSSE